MAVGIGLVFGVLRLVNFAYGQLVMAGAYALAFASQARLADVGRASLLCFAVVIALSIVMERLVFRPLRTQSPAVMLVTTFAVAFLLQNVALLVDVRDDTIGEPAASVASLNQRGHGLGRRRPEDHDRRDRRRRRRAARCSRCSSTRTQIGLQMRAAATDFATARLLGVRADTVIALAVLLSAVLAAAVAVLLTVQNPLVAPTSRSARRSSCSSASSSAGSTGSGRRRSAGSRSASRPGSINGALPTDKTVYLPSVVFALVILVLLVRPAGLFAGGGAGFVERV